MSMFNEESGIPSSMIAQPNEEASSDTNWQEESTLGECLMHLYESEQLVDVHFRCTNHVTGDPDNLLRAHKFVLAARSAVFLAMFYGPNRDDTKDEIVSEFSKQAMDIFFRYLYSDSTTMEIDIAEDVFRIAHFYQVTKLVQLCCDFIAKNLSIDNACTFLQLAHFYEQHQLRDHVIDYIDTNAKEVLNSDSFLCLSKDTLQYLLKGDTLHLEEITILKAVHAWAAPRLTEQNLEVRGENIRMLLGEDLFYDIRLPTMPLKDFEKVERAFNYYSKTETLDIVHAILYGTPYNIPLHFPNPRVPLFENIRCERKLPVFTLPPLPGQAPAPAPAFTVDIKFSQTFETYISSTRCLNGQILSIRLTLPAICIPCGRTDHKLDGEMLVSFVISCPELGFKQKANKFMKSGDVTLSIDPPLAISRNGVNLKVEIIPPQQTNMTRRYGDTDTVTLWIKRDSQRSKERSLRSTLFHDDDDADNDDREEDVEKEDDSSDSWASLMPEDTTDLFEPTEPFCQ